MAAVVPTEQRHPRWWLPAVTAGAGPDKCFCRPTASKNRNSVICREALSSPIAEKHEKLLDGAAVFISSCARIGKGCREIASAFIREQGLLA